jgi:GNAT superfamily N-acetyltransferase
MSGATTRLLTAADQGLLRIATLGNVNWVGERFTMSDVVDRPEFAHYTRLDIGRGDFGFVTERDGKAIGAVWAVFLPVEDAGFGFVDTQTPELSLWVDADERGRGLGRRLLQLLKDEARRRGIRTISLSVEAGNFAKRLYEAAGFLDVRGRERDGVMIWTGRGHGAPSFRSLIGTAGRHVAEEDALLSRLGRRMLMPCDLRVGTTFRMALAPGSISRLPRGGYESGSIRRS